MKRGIILVNIKSCVPDTVERTDTVAYCDMSFRKDTSISR